MTVDLTKARPGCEVATHPGTRLAVRLCEPDGRDFRIWFEGYAGWFDYEPDGRIMHQTHPHPLDIVSITPPPLTEAERLAEIAKIASEQCKRAMTVDRNAYVKILSLAESRSHD